jgi:hypothetical protein
LKYVPSALGVGQLSKSAGSTTAAHNRNGAYLRNRTIPTNPNTAKQAAVRNNFGALSAAWRALTDAQRTGWRTFGSEITRQDSLGQTYTLTGLQAFNYINLNLLTAGQSISSTAPAVGTPTAPTTASATAVHTGGVVSVNASGISAGHFLIFAGPPVSQGINFTPKSRLRFMLAADASIDGPYLITTPYAAIWGAFAAGEAIFLRIIPVDASGQAGVPVELRIIST